LIVASANGAAKNPAWYYNLAAHPDTVQIQIAGRTIAVSAEQLHGNARQHAWRHITSTADRFAKYEQKTDRELPVIRLRTQPNGCHRGGRARARHRHHDNEFVIDAGEYLIDGNDDGRAYLPGSPA
jgi:deazaflavin-dependent oxidoreductase (nitroreductase family)